MNDYKKFNKSRDQLFGFRQHKEYLLAQKLENTRPYAQLKKLSPQILLDAVHELIIQDVHKA